MFIDYGRESHADISEVMNVIMHYTSQNIREGGQRGKFFYVHKLQLVLPERKSLSCALSKSLTYLFKSL